ncbi:PTS system, mannose-specific IIB component [Marinilactibacillus psychrotolerans 42ea]|uniref:PTS system, mannose-specific IIB component n=3 Tax=Marinilactibacillus psychrotolerans TaxID=191770 RepID=A0A1R4J9F4_9LACT|nr:PTS system, mannose-specific IIB component [Marinilactibacillus psychrotolerans 42ea]
MRKDIKEMMDIKLARIDDRLVHGQVVTTWTKITGISRILVVSDEAASSELRKFLLKQASPPGVKTNVMTVEKLIEVSAHRLLDDVKVMLLFTNPTDVSHLVKAGVPIEKVNIGGMKFSNGKKMITNFVSVDETDIEAFKFLNLQGIELEIRKVPSDRKINLIDVLKKVE